MSPHADPLQPHSHDPNPAPPSLDSTIIFSLPNGTKQFIEVEHLHVLPAVSLANCYIVSTGHGTTGPFTFAGPTLLSLIQACTDTTDWNVVEVVSGDGFGTRITRKELNQPADAGPIILAYAIDRQSMSREQGLVRLIVPSERDDALRQVKWVEEVRIQPKESLAFWSPAISTSQYSRLRKTIIFLLLIAVVASIITLIMTFFSIG